jgi:uncharacterized membrane protein YqjE
MKQANALRSRFYVELVLSLAALFLALVTLVWNDWIEIVFKVDPDMGNGSLEKAIVAVLVLAAIVSAWLARTEWRSAREPALYPVRRR